MSARQRSEPLSSGELTSSDSEDSNLPCKIARRHLPSKSQCSNKPLNSIWKNVVQENFVEKAFAGTNFSSANSVHVERDSETYSFEEKDSDSLEIAVNISRKRPLEGRLSSRKYDEAIKRDHYGVDFKSSPSAVTHSIADFLEEEREDLIELVVDTLGVRRSLEFCYLTEDIEKCGGLLTADGSRRRTPGGSFLLLIRRSEMVTLTEKKVIFKESSDEKLKKKRLRKMQRRRERKVAATQAIREDDKNRDFEDLPSPDIRID